MGEEGTFSICTFWACEAAARLGMFKKEYLEKGRLMFEQMLGYSNHLGLFSEEIGKRGEHLGNFPQAARSTLFCTQHSLTWHARCVHPSRRARSLTHLPASVTVSRLRHTRLSRTWRSSRLPSTSTGD